MRFGQDFHRYQVPEWASLYVPYPSLKHLLNKAFRTEAGSMKTQPDFTGVYTSLGCSIDSFASFHYENFQLLYERGAELCRTYGVASEAHTLPKKNDANCYELGNFLKAIVELRKDLQKLQWYYRVNEEAIHRIYAKLERYGNLVGQFHQDHHSNWVKLKSDRDMLCSKFNERLNGLIAGIARVRSDAKLHATTRSLCLQSTRGQHTHVSTYDGSLCSFLINDQPPKLADQLGEMYLRNGTRDSHFQELIYDLANLSIASGARFSASFLLSEAFPRYGVAIDHKILNHIITISGRGDILKEHARLRACPLCDSAGFHDEVGNSLFLCAMEQLGPSRKDILSSKDIFGRTPLHYGALYGLPIICQSILGPPDAWGERYLASLILSLDSQGYTPLHYSVINNYATITRVFLDTLRLTAEIGDRTINQDLVTVLDDLFPIAIKYQYDDIVSLLGKCRLGFQTSSHGETALYVASRSGREDYVDALLNNGRDIEINMPESVHGWTPLFIACVEGHQAVAKLLLKAGAKQDLQDHFGWTAKEHAALRGHLALAETLDAWNTNVLSGGPASMPTKPVSGAKPSFRTDQSYVIVNLGTLQYGKQVKVVDLMDSSAENAMYTNNGLCMEISIGEGSSTSHLVELPTLKDMVNEPFVFPVSDPDKAWIAFKLFRKGHSDHNLVGSGAALLKSLNDCFGANRESLVRARSIAILKKETFNVMGTVTFTFVVAKPMARLASSFLPDHSIRGRSLQLVGHRGLGQNTASRSYLQLGENTVESFLSAARQGATFVEFDVQLTRDLLPVIYHDFSLSESGTDIPIHDLSFEQFMYVSKVQLPRGEPISVLGKVDTRSMPDGTNRAKLRSRSLTRDHEQGVHEFRDRMKYTVDFTNKGFKPNTRGEFIQDSFATLEELLVELPDSISFNIEIKYPRLHEAAEAGVAPVAIEINTFIDTVLEILLFHGRNKRAIILSSFTPEVCILLAIKQRMYPVMFITNAGKPPMTDMEMRASSMQAAIRFAKRWGLAGIVFASETLIACPRLIGYVKSSGLVCGSYGTQNNIPQNAKVQAAAGIDTLMADRVGLISAALNSASADN
ncbi:GDPD-domain-containing protein [Aspergillus leporis]|uniref:GDPD-domain-containing protein n=1 Tax=Aspergillus leporis TaxID=41062 RepID=A0A5N5WYY6_9EURO|nr:GDPD-domain-containing protein [Aspergillus leporis]